MEYLEDTEALANGAKLPTHPALTTARRVIKYGSVRDAADGTLLQRNLHRSSLAMLIAGNQMALQHLYLYSISDNRIFHTRPSVIIDVTTTDDDADSTTPDR